jgi:hypothetical protein
MSSFSQILAKSSLQAWVNLFPCFIKVCRLLQQLHLRIFSFFGQLLNLL